MAFVKAIIPTYGENICQCSRWLNEASILWNQEFVHSSSVGVNNDSLLLSIWRCLWTLFFLWWVFYLYYFHMPCFVPSCLYLSFGNFLKFLQHLAELWWKPTEARRSCSRVKYFTGLCRLRAERSGQVQRLVYCGGLCWMWPLWTHMKLHPVVLLSCLYVHISPLCQPSLLFLEGSITISYSSVLKSNLNEANKLI